MFLLLRLAFFSIISLSAVHGALSPIKAAATSKVVICGAGPAGLLTAHCLLARNSRARVGAVSTDGSSSNEFKYSVCIVESRKDPLAAEIGPRAYSLGLNIRGQKAIKYFDEKYKEESEDAKDTTIWGQISKRGVFSDAFFLHFGEKSFQLRKPSKSASHADDEGVKKKRKGEEEVPPTLLVARNKLCEGLLRSLTEKYGSSGLLEVKYETRIDSESISLQDRTCRLSDGSEIGYDLLIGTDGVQSAVRTAMGKRQPNTAAEMQTQPSFDAAFQSDESTLPGQYKVMAIPSSSLAPSLARDAVHAMDNSKAGFGMFLIPAGGNNTCALVSWKPKSQRTDSPGQNISLTIDYLSRGNESREISESKEAVEMKSYLQRVIAESYPKVGLVDSSSIDQLFLQRPSEAKTVRCNRYDDLKGRALLLGDAAHSTGGTLGQGANSALGDVVALDMCLDECKDDLDKALPLFSKRQAPEGLALWSLLQLPPKEPIWKALYLLSQLLRGVLSKVFKWISPPTQTMLSQSTTPFTTIVRKNSFWLRLALKGQKIIAAAL